MAAFFVVYPLLETLVWIGLGLDGLFFRGYRRETVTAPVFILGNPRSGTTFLHRLLAKDTKRFTTMRMWEILFAPSIAQRAFFQALAPLAHLPGQSTAGKLTRLERHWYRKYGMHEISFREPEEDDYLMLHIWSALSAGLSAGLIREALPYTYFDTALPASERKRILAFYKACIQRHLHACRLRRKSAPGIYLAKNPALCPKVRSVTETFPDARFIYLVRTPLEMVPSYISMMKHSWRAVGVRGRREELCAYITAMARHWYGYPLEQLHATQAEHVVVYYDDLVRDPEKTVRHIYRRLNLPIEAAFEQVLRQECTRVSHHKSRHKYDLAGTGMSRDELCRQFKETFECFGFRDKQAS